MLRCLVPEHKKAFESAICTSFLPTKLYLFTLPPIQDGSLSVDGLTRPVTSGGLTARELFGSRSAFYSSRVNAIRVASERMTIAGAVCVRSRAS